MKKILPLLALVVICATGIFLQDKSDIHPFIVIAGASILLNLSLSRSLNATKADKVVLYVCTALSAIGILAAAVLEKDSAIYIKAAVFGIPISLIGPGAFMPRLWAMAP